MNPVKERDKNYKRKSYLNRLRHTEAAPVNRLNESKKQVLVISGEFLLKCQ